MKKLFYMIQIVLCTLMASSIAGFAAGKRILVPKDFQTIQSAIDTAVASDTVLVEPGRYYENIDFKGKNIVVASRFILTKDRKYITQTIIDGSRYTSKNKASCVSIISKEDSTAVLEGFTLTGGKGSLISGYIEGGGVLLDQSNAVVRNNIITGNSVAAGGGGIAAWRGNPRILNNIVMNNTAEYAAGVVLNWSGGIVRNNIIYHNNKVSNNYLTGGLMLWDKGPFPQIIENNVIVGNYSFNTAGGLSIDGTASPIVKNNIIWGNRQGSGPQVTGNASYISYCDIEDGTGGVGNINSFPFFRPDTFTLTSGSACIDAGDNSVAYNDPENDSLQGIAAYPSSGTIRNDMGAFGGQGTQLLSTIHFEDIFSPDINYSLVKVGTDIEMKSEVLNMGTSSVVIDSMKLLKGNFTLKKGLNNRELRPFENDYITVQWKPDASVDNLKDTLLVYHSFKNIENPKKIIVSGKAFVGKKPVADAGRDTAIVINEGRIKLDGSRSYDLEKLAITYLWGIADAPSGSKGKISNITVKSTVLLFDLIGRYLITLQVDNGFYKSTPDTLIVNVTNSTSVKDLDETGRQAILVYPNPVADKMNITINSNESEFVHVVLVDCNGQIVLSKPLRLVRGNNPIAINLNRQEISAGIYFLKLTGENTSFIRMVIVK